MTLVQLLTNETSIHMTCDFRLTDPWTGETKSNLAHKLISLHRLRLRTVIGFTGIALLQGSAVGNWIAQRLERLEADASIEDLLQALKEAEQILPSDPGTRDRRLTFVVGAIIGSQSLIAIVSNFEQFISGRIRRSLSPAATMSITQLKPKAASYFATGDATTIKPEDYDHLLLALRSGAPDLRIQEQMHELNELISERTTTISPGCYAASLHATGTGSTRPFLTDEQQGDFIPPELAGVLNQIVPRLGRKLDAYGRPMPIRLVQSASAYTGGTSSYFREQFKLRPDDAELWNNYGSFLANQGKRSEAVEAYEKAVTLNPSNVTALANLAKQNWLHLKDFPRAHVLYNEVVEVGGSSVTSSTLSDFAVFCYEAIGDSKRAAELHKRAAQDQSYPIAAAQWAWFVLDHQKDIAKATELIEFALAKDPNNSHIAYIAGLISLYGLNDRQAACQKFHKACSLDPHNEPALRQAADTSLQLGDSSSAAYYYRKLIERSDYDAEVHGNYGLALLMGRKLRGALNHLSEAADQAPSNLIIRINLAAAQLASGKKDEAIALAHSMTDAGTSPQIQLEANALLWIAEPASRIETAEKIKELIEEGHHTDRTTVRAAVTQRSGRNREEADRVADVIEGKVSIPAVW